MLVELLKELLNKPRKKGIKIPVLRIIINRKTKVRDLHFCYLPSSEMKERSGNCG
jgi:hypothetical protein